jgi:hypothetical protein
MYGEIRANPAGRILWEIWEALPGHYPRPELDTAIVMPDQFRGILWIKEGEFVVGAIHESPQQQERGIHNQDEPAARILQLRRVPMNFNSFDPYLRNFAQIANIILCYN